VANGVQLSSATLTYIRFKISGSYSSSALYSSALAYNTTTANGGGNSSVAQMQVSVGFPTVGAGIATNFICYVHNPSSSSLLKTCNIAGQSWSVSSIVNFTTSGFYNATTPLTGVRFFGAAGNITGTFRLYGIKNS
jgi:hypothetical protein